MEIMLQSERYERIEELIYKNGIIHTSKVAQMLGVTEKTIRLDFEELERQGKLTRVHGGAKRNIDKIVTSRDEKQMKERTENLDIKESICRKAASYVQDGACIFLDGGSSIVPMLSYLKHKNIKIVTNSQLIVNAFDEGAAELFVIGGSYIPKYNMTAGPLAIAEIQKFNFDYAFISCLGADIERKMIYTSEMETMAVKEAVMKLAQNNVLLIDTSKLYIKGFCSLISLDNFDIVLCNNDGLIVKEELPQNFQLENTKIGS